MFYCFNFKNFFKKLVMTIIVIGALAAIVRYIILPSIFIRKYGELVEKYSAEYDLDENLVYAVIFVESNFDESAVSVKDAKGLMQITDRTGTWGAEEIGIEGFSPEMLFEPEINIHIGCWYLNVLSKQYDFEIETALAAYNAGSGNVSGWLEDGEYSSDLRTLHTIPFEETQKYVMKVTAIKKVYDYIY
ncbi:lytic transglycosylase domain-containing protein [Anaerotignum faecicola]|nr:lytic transglycosylase domain-containing protein [Anaerotignum faecicola]